MLRTLTAGLVCFASLSLNASAQTSSPLALMPQPRSVTIGQGSLPIGPAFGISIEAPDGDALTASASQRLEHSFERVAGHSMSVTKGKSVTSGRLVIVVHEAATAEVGPDESYRLQITPQGARLDAATSLGALHGMATLRQLVSGQGQNAQLPAVTVEDSPLYAWRGVMIDTSRHFVPMDVLERTLDAMELVKLNVLHFHLSDNEGFRVESKIFPKLQKYGSEGEFYTQDELRRFVRDAALRGIVVVPEFDMPSHAQSWLAGYPELSASPGPFHPGPIRFGELLGDPKEDQIMHVMETKKFPAFDPTLDSTYEFLDRFIGEMTSIFPAPYIHIGADENNGAVWKTNPEIVAFMKAHQIADAPALQAYFVDRVNALLKKHDRTMVAWEEAYAPSSKIGGVYQLWLPEAKVDLMKMQLPANDHLLISRGFYLDVFLPAYAHYMSQDLPDTKVAGLPLLGGEAAMWTEMADRNNIEARMWPRTGAVAERLWTPGISGDYAAFSQRLFRLSAVLDREGLHNLVEYHEGVKAIAGGGTVPPVETLLDVLTPLKGYKRLMARNLAYAPPTAKEQPLDQVADVVLVDSQAKYRFRSAVAAFLAQPGPATATGVRTWLTLWAGNEALLRPEIAHSEKLAKVSAHSQQLADLSAFTLTAMDQLEKGQTLSSEQMVRADELLKAGATAEGETDLAVIPELTGLLYGALAPEPTSYPLF